MHLCLPRNKNKQTRCEVSSYKAYIYRLWEINQILEEKGWTINWSNTIPTGISIVSPPSLHCEVSVHARLEMHTGSIYLKVHIIL